jgi:hypothetical protein
MTSLVAAPPSALLLQASLSEHCIIESKPDSSVDDLRWVAAAAGGVQTAAYTS